jgi:hypothetical protein
MSAKAESGRRPHVSEWPLDLVHRTFARCVEIKNQTKKWTAAAEQCRFSLGVSTIRSLCANNFRAVGECRLAG